MTIADKLMYIPKDDTLIYTFCTLQWMAKTFRHNEHNKPKKHNSIKV